MRAVATAQFRVMRETLELQFAEQKRSAEPIFVWNGGAASGDNVEWKFINEGGPISYLTVTMRSPTGAPINVQAEITPTQWLGQSREGWVRFKGDVHRELLFTIGFQTRLGGVGGFFFSASRNSMPVLTGSGWD